MIQISLSLDAINYENSVPFVVSLFIKNPVAAKAAEVMLLNKLKNKTQSEKDKMLSEFINEQKNKIIKIANDTLNEKQKIGYLCNISSDIV